MVIGADDSATVVVRAPHADDGSPPTQAVAGDASVGAPRDDYAWTHSATVDGLFAVLTIIVVPVAVMRWTKRLRTMTAPTAGGRGNGF